MAPPVAQQTAVRVAPVSHKQPARDVISIVVMVGGTVDPINSDPKARSASYRNPRVAAPLDPKKDNDPDWYWGTNRLLREELEKLQKKYRSLYLFIAHGWTGDNSPTNRRIAGAYLADRLCGGNGEQAYYKGFLQSEVSIHLIGHSHGGNVINEFTHRAATSKQWPKQWKIRSITYLSTPFFKRLHPVDTGAFDKDCRVLNVYCKYDLTQRVIADFSLFPLNDVLQQVRASELVERIAQVKFDTGRLQSAMLSVDVQLTGKKWYQLDPKLLMDAKEGKKLYEGVLSTLKQLHAVFDKARQIVDRLHQGIDYPVPKELDAKLTKHRQVMSDALASKFRLRLDEIERGLDKTEKAFQARLKSGKFPHQGFFEDLHVTAFLLPLVRFLSVDRTSLKGPLWDLVHELLREQIHEFDNTGTSPSAQLRGTPFANRIVDLPITTEDLLFGKGKDAAFDKFIARLEGIEARYAQSPAQHALMDLLFTLIAQMEPLRTVVSKWATAVDWYEGMVRSQAWVKSKLGTQTDQDKLVLRFVQTLESYALIFKDRDCGSMQVDDPKIKLEEGDPPLGSIPYLAIKAHSTSRMKLYPKVKTALEGQFNTLPRAGG
ncbi:hypothetical protein [Cystobacter fuscus]|uniref:hypothetical protein n=1 Tax=Cystobacter fuscus TaxID=43 RepID=UPI002B2F9FF2|nr:hypothetical protein F0U63_40405 [Cystobacter fuscus]